MTTEQIKQEIKEAIRKANLEINPEVKPYIDAYDGTFSAVLKENCKVASEKGLPLCQDTGLLEFFCWKGRELVLDRTLQTLLDEAVADVYTSNPFRYSSVGDPLFDRTNRLNDTPAMVHIFETEGADLRIKFLIKGGGSENLSRLYMMSPSATPEEIKNKIVEHIEEAGARSCPPLKIGVGLGGTSEKAMLLSKLALTESIHARHADARYVALEKETETAINALHVGFQGLGTGISCYNVRIMDCETHIATLPLAISVDCYICRTGEVIFQNE